MFESWNTTVQLALILGWFYGSLLVWAGIVYRRWQGLPILEPSGQPALPIPHAVFAATVLWLGLQVVSALNRFPTTTVEPSVRIVQIICGINFVIAAVLPLSLAAGGRPLAGFGLSTADWRRQIGLGLLAFLAAVWPTALMLVVSMSWRNLETQHSHLQALRNPENTELVAWIVISAAIAAPLAEELLFRVTLQGWLAERLPAPLAIGVVAVIFALVHGWRDALPLLPLALILGYLFHQTRSYWACVIAHAHFNACNLAMVLLADFPADSAS